MKAGVFVSLLFLVVYASLLVYGRCVNAKVVLGKNGQKGRLLGFYIVLAAFF
jgi:hypothetical protein